jgi:hypothetical protein
MNKRLMMIAMLSILSISYNAQLISETSPAASAQQEASGPVSSKIAQFSQIAQGLSSVVPENQKANYDKLLSLSSQAVGIAKELEDFESKDIQSIKSNSASLQLALKCVNNPDDPACKANFACNDKISCSVAALLKTIQLLEPVINLIGSQSEMAKSSKDFYLDQGALNRAVRLPIIPKDLSDSFVVKITTFIKLFNQMKDLIVKTVGNMVARSVVNKLYPADIVPVEKLPPVIIPADKAEALDVKEAAELKETEGFDTL